MARRPDQSSGTTAGLRARAWLEGAGIGILLTLGLTWNQLSPTHLDLYHKLLPITTVVRAIALGLVAACLLGTALIRILERLDRSGRTLLWALLFAALAARALGGLIVAQVVDRKGVTPLRAFLLTGGVLLLVWLGRRKWYAGAIRGLRMVLLLLGFSIFWALPSLVLAGFARQPHDEVAWVKPVKDAGAPHRRVVWVLFDEMSYDQTFEHRWPGLEMPNFDRLRGQSVTFTNAQPDGYFTEEVIPSLLLGRPIVEARSTEAGELLYRSQKGGGWDRFAGKATIFADAQKAGWTTGISGDYNPYCRLLKDQLDWCWMRLTVWGDHLGRDKSTWGNLTAPLHAAWARARHERWEPAPTEAEKYAEMIRQAQGLLGDDNIDLAFVHLYLPHPPALFDRKTGEVKLGGSYIDNLALADRTLGELEQTLSQTRSVGETTLVVSSDHSWRMWLWRNGMGWTDEDELASGRGKFDPRPMLMVRLPGESTGVQIQAPVPLLGIHDLLQRMIAGQVGTPEQMESWATQRSHSQQN